MMTTSAQAMYPLLFVPADFHLPFAKPLSLHHRCYYACMQEASQAER